MDEKFCRDCKTPRNRQPTNTRPDGIDPKRAKVSFSESKKKPTRLSFLAFVEEPKPPTFTEGDRVTRAHRIFTVIVTLLQILRQCGHIPSRRQLVPLDRRQGVSEGLGARDVAVRTSQMKRRVAAEIPEGRISARQDQTSDDHRLMRQCSQMQRRLPVVIKNVQ